MKKLMNMPWHKGCHSWRRQVAFYLAFTTGSLGIIVSYMNPNIFNRLVKLPSLLLLGYFERFICSCRIARRPNKACTIIAINHNYGLIQRSFKISIYQSLVDAVWLLTVYQHSIYYSKEMLQPELPIKVPYLKNILARKLQFYL